MQLSLILQSCYCIFQDILQELHCILSDYPNFDKILILHLKPTHYQ